MGARRPLTLVERAVLDGFLSVDFPGVAELRAQARDVMAGDGCTCGCGTIDLITAPGATPSGAPSPVPVDGTVTDLGGDPIGGLVLFTAGGLLDYLEIYSFDGPLPMPAIEDVTWV